MVTGFLVALAALLIAQYLQARRAAREVAEEAARDRRLLPRAAPPGAPAVPGARPDPASTTANPVVIDLEGWRRGATLPPGARASRAEPKPAPCVPAATARRTIPATGYRPAPRGASRDIRAAGN